MLFDMEKRLNGRSGKVTGRQGGPEGGGGEGGDGPPMQLHQGVSRWTRLFWWWGGE